MWAPPITMKLKLSSAWNVLGVKYRSAKEQVASRAATIQASATSGNNSSRTLY